jgi:hypothetical protein
MGDEKEIFHDAVDTEMPDLETVEWMFDNGEDVVFSGLDGKVYRQMTSGIEVSSLPFLNRSPSRGNELLCSFTPSKPTLGEQYSVTENQECCDEFKETQIMVQVQQASNLRSNGISKMAKR